MKNMITMQKQDGGCICKEGNAVINGKGHLGSVWDTTNAFFIWTAINMGMNFIKYKYITRNVRNV